jgi:tripartite-type tricarboxylate transporter receptor subunit TctC
MKTLTLRARRALIGAIGAVAVAAPLSIRPSAPGPGLSSPGAPRSARGRQPLHIVVPFGVGGTADRLARAIGERLAPRIGVAVVIENRPGAGGAIGTASVARAAPDGRVLGLATQSTHAALPALHRNLPYDPIADFEPVAMLARVPHVLAVHRSVAARDASELIALARQRPRALSFGSPGVGSLGHLRMLQFSAMFGIDLLHVPYHTIPSLLADAMSGRLHLFGDNLLTALVFLGHSLRPIAVSGRQRVAALPRVPTFAEAGLDEAGDLAWFGLVAPAATPTAIVGELNDALRDVMSEPGLTRLLAPSGSQTVAAEPPSRFRDEMIATLRDFRHIVSRYGLSAA